MLWEAWPRAATGGAPDRENYDIIQLCLLFNGVLMIRILGFDDVRRIRALCKQSNQDIMEMEPVFHDERDRAFEALIATSAYLRGIVDMKGHSVWMQPIPRRHRDCRCCFFSPECKHMNLDRSNTRTLEIHVDNQFCESCQSPCICTRGAPAARMRTLKFCREGLTYPQNPDDWIDELLNLRQLGRSLVTLKIKRTHVLNTALDVRFSEHWTPIYGEDVDPRDRVFQPVHKVTKFSMKIGLHRTIGTRHPRVKWQDPDENGIWRERDIGSWGDVIWILRFGLREDFRPDGRDARPRA
jgi:hypothetical protein